ncbi:MAG: hypothetical protein FJZ01_12695 [Candidatus Sericytochromatia bacterium]|nr:hypothetical protein [Candidatus Tanganyikabacteria bacterium]
MLADHTTAPIDARLRATLDYLRLMVQEPESLGPADARAALAAGVTREALADAINVAYLFAIYDRLADALGWDVPPEGSGFYESAARMLLWRGYR